LTKVKAACRRCIIVPLIFIVSTRREQQGQRAMKRTRRSVSYLSAVGMSLLAATAAASAQSAPVPTAPGNNASAPATGSAWGPGFMMGPGMMHGAGMWGGRFDGPCDPRTAGMAEWRIDQIERVVQPTEAQRAALADLRAASAKAADAIRSACPRDIPQTSVQRMAFMEKRMEAMLTAIKTVRPAFEAFYATMDDEQKARLDGVGPRRWGWHWRWWN
jgi:hypothetical protein